MSIKPRDNKQNRLLLRDLGDVGMLQLGYERVGVLQPDHRGSLRPTCVVIFFGLVFVGLLVLTGGKL
jgi:hypothetical protein